MKDKVVKIFFFASLAFVLIAFIAAWFYVESPKVARARRLDQIVMNNISNIESAINSYYDKNKKLPENIEVLKNNSDFYLSDNILKDPETGASIIYNKKGDKDFELCATFRTSNKEQNDQNGPYYTSASSQMHSEGYQCLKGNLYIETNNILKKIDVNREAVPATPAQTAPATKTPANLGPDSQAKPSFPTPAPTGSGTDGYYIN